MLYKSFKKQDLKWGWGWGKKPKIFTALTYLHLNKIPVTFKITHVLTL